MPRSASWSPGLLLRPILFLASLSLFAAAYASRVNVTAAVLLAFLFVELAVGMYFPCISALKSTKCISERKRGLIYSLYRVPLNAFALGVLLKVWPCEAWLR